MQLEFSDEEIHTLHVSLLHNKDRLLRRIEKNRSYLLADYQAELKAVDKLLQRIVEMRKSG